MSEQPENGTPEEATAAEPVAPVWTPPPASASPSPAASGPAAIAQERPEVAVGAAFAGGFVFALILKRLAR